MRARARRRRTKDGVCPKCGAGEKKPDRRCLGCGLVSTERDCPKCGRPTSRGTGAAVVSPFVRAAQEPAEVCRKCKRPLPASTRICSHCGERTPPDRTKGACTKLVRVKDEAGQGFVHCRRPGRLVGDASYVCDRHEKQAS